MSNSDLVGVIAAVVTPVDVAFEIDATRLAHHCERLLNNGCSFVSTFGTTGEGASLSSAKKVAAMQQLKAEGADLSKHIPSVMTPISVEAGVMIAEAYRLGSRAVLVLPPFYYDDPTNEGIVAFIADALKHAGNPDIDLLLYNIPRFSRIAYTPDLIDLLIERFGSAVVGLKDSTGVAANAEMLVDRFPKLSIFTGDDRVMPGLVEAGGAGMIGGMPNVFSADLRRIYDAPSSPVTEDLRAKSASRIEVVNDNGSMLALKAILATMYGDPEWGRAVPPLLGLSEQQSWTVLRSFEATGFDASKVS